MFGKSKEKAEVSGGISIIGAEVTVNGDITAKEAIRIEGSVIGNVDTTGGLTISATGKVKGNVKGGSIVIGGALEGNLLSFGKTEVISTGKITGNIRTRSLTVDENAEILGECVIKKEELVELPKPGEVKRIEDKKEYRGKR